MAAPVLGIQPFLLASMSKVHAWYIDTYEGKHPQILIRNKNIKKHKPSKLGYDKLDSQVANF